MASSLPQKIGEIWDAWFPRVLSRLRLKEHQIFLALTLIVGLVAGLAAVLFHLAIDEVRRLFFGGLEDPSLLRLILVPTLVSLVTGFLLHRYFRDSRGSGVPQTTTAYLLHEGVIPMRVPIGKFLTGVLTIGAGHSMGREGPSLQIGAGLASLLGRWFKLSAANVKNLVPVGGAAAIGAAFNTPIAAVLFALEEIVGDLNAAMLGSTVLASVAATVLARSILGNEPLFSVPGYELGHPLELVAYAALGVVGGAVSVLFSRWLLRARAQFRSLPEWTIPWQPAMGGLAIGLIAATMAWQEWPTVMGVGYESVDVALNGNMILTTLLLLGAAKVVATIISYASGNAGGIFAPSLFIGAMLGGAMGTLIQNVAPFPTGDPGAYALVGMGALFAGIIRAPMTSVFMIFELTQDYEIVLPLMIANMISYAISRHYQSTPVYHALLVQDGIHLPEPGERAKMGRWRVGDLMTREPHTLEPALSVSQALKQSRDWPEICFPVCEEDHFLGLVTRKRLEETVAGDGGEKPLAEVLTKDGWAHVHTDQPLELALERFSQTPGLLPVISRSDAKRLEGVISLENVLRAFNYQQQI